MNLKIMGLIALLAAGLACAFQAQAESEAGARTPSAPGATVDFANLADGDVVLPDLPELGQPLPANEHIRHYGKGQTSAELDLAEGEHTLQLLLADFAHVAHDPPVMSEVITITVSSAAALPADS